MIRIGYRNCALSLAAAGVLLAGPVSAQTALTQKAPAIDPKAQELLKQSAAVYASLRSYSCEAAAELKVDSLPGSRRINLKIAFQRPAQAAVSVSKYGETQQFLTDGKSIYSYSADRNEYSVNTLPANISPSALVLTQGESFVGLLLLKPDGLLTNAGNIKFLTLGEPEILGGARVQTVTKVMSAKNGGGLTFFVSIGTKDHLIYRFASTLQSPTPLPIGDGKAKRVDTTEDYSGIQINQSLPASAFLPPPDAKKAEPDKQDQK